MSGHTKGNWVVSSSVLVCTEKAQLIANTMPLDGVTELALPMKEAIANARLISTAPLGLELAEKMLDDKVAWGEIDTLAREIIEANKE